MSYTATTRLVMKLGTIPEENIEAHIYEVGDLYDVDPAAATTYTNGLIAFPYAYEA